jgi:RNA polymerase sigma factor (sigma-70 family)
VAVSHLNTSNRAYAIKYTSVSPQENRLFVAAMENTHGRALRRFLASRMRHAHADVPDLVQEVFLRLLRITDHETIRNPQAYIYTIASHLLHQYALRQTVTAGATSDPLDITAELEASLDFDPAEQAQLEQRFEAIGKGLEQLSPRAYATLLLYRCEGATLVQIGQRFGVTRKMAKKYLIKALTYCRQSLMETA